MAAALFGAGAGPDSAGAPSARTTDAKTNGAAREPLERRPYRIRTWIFVDPASRLDSNGRAALIDAWRNLIRRFVGTAWDIEIATGDGPFASGTLEALEPKGIASYAEGVDKAWMIVIAPGEGDGYLYSAREFDVNTGRIGLVCRRPARHPADAARSLLQLALDVFRPFAEIGESAAGGVNITVQAGALAPADPVGRVVGIGTVFQPHRVFQRPNGTTLRIDPIRWSYLRVDNLEGPVAHCSIISGYRDPLSKRVVGRNRLIALGLKPSAVPTRFQFLTSPPDTHPAAGYTVTVRRLPDGQAREVGMTDREGRIVLPPGYADGLVVYRLLAGDVEPLVEFPGMPGETAEERVVKVQPLTQTVTLETRLNALKDEVVDLVAVRKRLKVRLKARFEAEAWDEMKAILDEYHRLRPRSSFIDRLNQLREDAARQQQETKKPVLTRTAQAFLADTESLILRYLDDDYFTAYEKGWQEAQEMAKAAQAGAVKKSAPSFAAIKAGAGKAAPASPPPGGAGQAPTPAQAPAGGGRNAPVQANPSGGGF